MKKFELTITHQKILDTIRYLNDLHLYPTHEGAYKILTAVNDEEMKNYNDVPTWGTLISFSSKKICRYILPLLRYGYLTKVFDKKTDELYLAITFKGRESSDLFHKRYKKSYSKKVKNHKPTIVRIEKYVNS